MYQCKCYALAYGTLIDRENMDECGEKEKTANEKEKCVYIIYESAFSSECRGVITKTTRHGELTALRHDTRVIPFNT